MFSKENRVLLREWLWDIVFIIAIAVCHDLKPFQMLLFPLTITCLVSKLDQRDQFHACFPTAAFEFFSFSMRFSFFFQMTFVFRQYINSLSNFHTGVLRNLEPWHTAVVNGADSNSMPLYYRSLENKTLITALTHRLLKWWCSVIVQLWKWNCLIIGRYI
jgi:hypothetical protein